MDQDYEADICCRPNVQAAYLHLIGRYEERFLFLHYFHLFANDLAAKNLLLVLTDHEHVVAHVTEFFRLWFHVVDGMAYPLVLHDAADERFVRQFFPAEYNSVLAFQAARRSLSALSGLLRCRIEFGVVGLFQALKPSDPFLVEHFFLAYGSNCHRLRLTAKRYGVVLSDVDAVPWHVVQFLDR